ncbi:hypothetical protein [Arthrobacter pigmenti]
MENREQRTLETTTQLLDSAIQFADRVSKARVERHRRRHPSADTEQLVKLLDRDLIVALTGQGVGVGSAAAAPGVGTAAALVMSGGEAAITMNWTAVYVLALAEVRGIPLADIERKRALMLTVLMGGSGQQAAAKVAGRTGRFWSSKLVSKVPLSWLRVVNSAMGRNFVTKYGTKQGIVVLGRVVPFGIGAAIGGTMNYVMAQGLIKSAHRVFEVEAPATEVAEEDIVVDPLNDVPLSHAEPYVESTERSEGATAVHAAMNQGLETGEAGKT